MIFQTEEKKLNGYGLEVKGRVNKDKWNLENRQKTTAGKIKINRRRMNMRKNEKQHGTQAFQG